VRDGYALLDELGALAEARDDTAERGLTEVGRRLARLPVDPRLARFKGLIVYGDDPGSGVARATTKRLMRTGYKGVKMFAGGLSEWKSAGLKLEGAPAPAPSTPAVPPTDAGGFGKPPTSGNK
jgi:hypothetical protein